MMRVLAWAAVAFGAVLMLAGVAYGLIADDFDQIMVGLVLECVGAGVMIPGLHGVIEG